MFHVTVGLDVASGWWEYQRLSRGSREERRALEAGHPARVYANWNEVTARIIRGGLPALDIVVGLIRAAEDDEAVMVVGAGPLEDLLNKHGNALVDDVEREAARNPRFRLALTGAWLAHGMLDPDVEMRLSQWTSVRGLPGHGGNG